MNAPDFIELVRRMRAAQKQYFRDRNNLDECKKLEREVDKAIEILTGEPTLFQTGKDR